MNQPERSAPQRRLLAARRYARLLRLYPRAHRQAFGEQMRRTFRDHFGDAVERRGESESWFWLEVIRDEGKSIVREHLAALTERIGSMKTILAAPLWPWRRRQTRRLALVTQLCLIAAVLLLWTPLLVGRVVLATAQHGLLHARAGTVSYTIGAAVGRPTTQFIAAFTQATGEIVTHELRAYHFSSSRIEISTLPLALARIDASAGTSGASAASTPPFLLDGEPAARLAGDLRVVAGRLPVPAAGMLEVVVTQATADQLHLALGTDLSVPALAGWAAPVARVVGIIQTTGTVFPTNRATFDPANMDSVGNWAQSHPLAYVLTSTEAIGAYAYNWAQIETVEQFYSQSSGPNPVPRSENPSLWQAWWIGTTDYARMNAQALTAFVSHRAPDPSPRLNQLLDMSPLAQQTGFAPGGTWAGFYEGNADDEDATVYSILFFWVLAALTAALLVAILGQVAGQLAERQQALLASLRDRERNRGISRGRLVVGGSLALQVLAPTGLALLAGGLLALLLARWVAAAMLPVSVRPVVDTLVSGPLDTGYGFGLAGGIAALLLVLTAVLVMLLAMRCALRRAMAPELAGDY